MPVNAYYYPTLTYVPGQIGRPAPVNLEMWFVDRIPYNPAPLDSRWARAGTVNNTYVANVLTPVFTTIDKWHVDRIPYIIRPVDTKWAITGKFFLAEPVATLPPAPNTLDKWQVERYPWNPTATQNYAAIYNQAQDGRAVLALPPPDVKVAVLNFFDLWSVLASYRPALPVAVDYEVTGSPMEGLNEEHVLVDKYQSYWAYPYTKPYNAATLFIGAVGPTFPLPFSPASAIIGFLPSNTPWESVLNYKKDFTALNAQQGAYQLLQYVPPSIDVLAFKDYTVFLSRKPDYSAAIANYSGQVSPTIPLQAASLIGPLAAWFQEWFPQWQKHWPYEAAEAFTNFTSPIFPQPFVPTIVIGIPWWQQEVFQQWVAGRFDWERLYSGSVQNISPITGPVPSLCSTITVPSFVHQLPDTQVLDIIRNKMWPIATRQAAACEIVARFNSRPDLLNNFYVGGQIPLRFLIDLYEMDNVPELDKLFIRLVDSAGEDLIPGDV